MKHQSVLFFISKLVTALIAFLLVVIRSREFPPESLSDYYLVTKSTSIIIAVLITWVPESCMRFYKETTNKKTFYSTYGISLAFSCFIALVVSALLGLVPGFDSIYAFFPYITMLVLTQGINDSISAAFRMSGNALRYSASLILSSCLNLMVFLVLPAKIGVGSIFIAVAASYLAGGVFGFFVLKIYKNFSIHSFDKHLLKQSLQYATPLAVVWCSIWIFTSSDTFVINLFCDKEQVSYYNMAEGIVAQSIGTILSSFSFAIFPSMIAQWNPESPHDLETALGGALSLILKYLIPSVIGLATISFYIYGPIIDPAYNPNNEGSFLICLFSISQLMDIFFQTYAKIWNLEKKTIASAIVSMGSAIFNLAFTILAVRISKSYLWAAGITVITIFLRTIITVFLFRRKFKISIHFKTVASSTLASLIMAAVLFLFLNYTTTNIWTVLVSVIFGVIIFVSLMSIFGEMNGELNQIGRFFVRRKK